MDPGRGRSPQPPPGWLGAPPGQQQQSLSPGSRHPRLELTQPPAAAPGWLGTPPQAPPATQARPVPATRGGTEQPLRQQYAAPQAPPQQHPYHPHPQHQAVGSAGYQPSSSPNVTAYPVLRTGPPPAPPAAAAVAPHVLDEVESARLGMSPRHSSAGRGSNSRGSAARAQPPPQQQPPQQVLGPRRSVWKPLKPPNPFKKQFSLLAFLLYLAFLGACGYYFYVRIVFTLGMGHQTWYAIVVLVVELMGLSAVLPYGFLLVWYTGSASSRGLPLDDGRVVMPPDKCFHVRVLVPCYKESMDVIINTVGAALEAEVPPGVTRTVYLCDDGKDPQKKEWIDSLGKQAQYVTGRVRTPGEINGKSANVNNCLKNVVYADYEGRWGQIPLTELVVVFDADMAAKKNFFLKVLEAMWPEEVSLCLTPQAFSNINPGADIFNNINQQFWEYVLPGCDAWGYIACTGTNFCLRARSLAAVGWFPEYTITEDYALSMELKAGGFKGRYLAEYLAVGEAPDEVRNVCRQRSRWTKGHMQIFFSKRCPLLNWRLPLLHKLLYTNGTWAYFCTIATTMIFVMVPFMSLVFGYHPVVFSRNFAIAATVYLPLNVLLMNYVRKPSHLKGQWMASISNHVLCFTYMKAVVNTLLSKLGVKEKAGFKATEKSGGQGGGAVAAMKRMGSNMMAGITRQASRDLPTSAAAVSAGGPPPPVRIRPPPQKKKKERRGCWMWVNAKTLEGALDPLALAISACISGLAIAAGVFTIIRSQSFDFQVNSWSDFTGVFTGGRLNVYIFVPILWAVYNLLPPLLFFVYFFTKGRLLQLLCAMAQVAGLVLALGAVAILWLMVPNTYDLKGTLPVVASFLDAQKSGPLPASAVAAYPWLENPSDLQRLEPIRGGYYMSDDYVKYSFPMATSTAMLAWTVLQFGAGYTAAGQLAAVQQHVRWGADYLMKAHTATSNFVVQVGSPAHYLLDLEGATGSWGPPSAMPTNRTAYTLDLSSPGGSDAVSAASAALAATAVLFADSDSTYAASALTHAQQLYRMATQMANVSASYCVAVPCAEGLPGGGYRWKAFVSSSVYDDMAWAAAWLHKATGQPQYASEAAFYMRQHLSSEARLRDPTYYVPNYDNMVWAAHVLMAGEMGWEANRAAAAQFVRAWMTGKNDAAEVLLVTPRGLSHLGDEPLPSAASASLLTLLYASTQKAKHNGFITTNMKCFALQQVHYTLGGTMGQDGRSYVVGVGRSPPRQPQHRQASCPTSGDTCNIRSALLAEGRNPSVIQGALVAGPDAKDGYVDSRIGLQGRVGVHYNVPLMGAMAGLLQLDVRQGQCQSERGWYQTIFLDFAPR